MSLNTLMPFIYGETMIRAEVRENGPLFAIVDLCTALGIGNPSDVPKRLHPDDLDTIEVIDSMGRKQKLNACNESGLYALIFQSRKAVAKEFTRWVTSEVLPTIRRTGSYAPGLQTYMALVRDQVALGVSPDLAAHNALILCPPAVPPQLAVPELKDRSLDELIERMEVGRSYCQQDLRVMLPSHHPVSKGRVRLPEFMRPAEADGRVRCLQEGYGPIYFRQGPASSN